MTHLPISRMTLYKHGVGFFERRAKLSGEEVEVSFRAEEVNDVLKSLTVIDWGAGQVRGIDYATPQRRQEQLAGCSVNLGDDRSLRDLLVCLRGRRVRLLLDQGEEAAGILLGLDELPERQPVAASLVSVLLEASARVQAVGLGRVQSVEILDERGAGDLRFFLQTALTQDAHRRVTIRLTPGEHDLSVSYVAPAPTWRVSYRLVVEETEADGRRALLLGWGIFDNRLEEDLEGVALALVAGMPISFVYDLSTPYTPQRPVVREEARVAAAPVEFAAEWAMVEAEDTPSPLASPARSLAMAAAPARRPAREIPGIDVLQKAAPVTTTGEALGELFQYVIGTPVTVGRGQSAMVPILSSHLGCRKDLLYNVSTQSVAAHPVATLRLRNETGLTLERGPVTVIEGGAYVGEALLPFTVPGGEVVVPYAVELGVKVREESGSSRQIHGLQVREGYLHVEEWDIRWREIQLNNSTGEPAIVLVEHPRTSRYELFDTPQPKEYTPETYRFDITIPAHGEAKLRVQERTLLSRREELRRQSYQGLQHFLQQGLIERRTHAAVAQLLKLWEQVADSEKAVEAVESERQKHYKAQQQVQGNMAPLSTTGKEGALRARYVEQLQASEDQLLALNGQEKELQARIERLKTEIGTCLQALEQPRTE